MNVLTALRAANIARQAEWDPTDQLPLAFRVIELGGEVGEALNLVKKLERERLGLKGSRATPAQLGEELADVVICADLVAMAIDYEPLEFDWPGRTDRLCPPSPLTLLFMAGIIAGQVEEHEEPSKILRAGALEDIEAMIWHVVRIADAHEVDLDAAIVAKFNATSEKVGLKTRMPISAHRREGGDLSGTSETTASIPCPYCGAPCDSSAVGDHTEDCAGYGPHADLGLDPEDGL